MSKRWLGLLLIVVMTWIGGGGVARADDPAITVTPDPITATATVVGTPTTGTGSILSTLSTPVAVTLTQATDGDCGQFTITSPTSLTLAPGASQPITINFAPTTAGTKTCSVDVVKDSDASIPVTFHLSGTATGIAKIATLLTPSDFGHIDVSTTSTPQTLTVKNIGTATLTISSAAIQTNPANYQVQLASGTQSIPPNGTTSWTIACTPQAAGGVDDKFHIVSDSTTNNPLDVALTCTGDLGKLVLDPTSLNLPFGAVSVGDHNDLSATFTNTGNVAVDNIVAAFDHDGIGYSITGLKTSLAAGASETVTVTFKPLNNTDGGPAALTFTGNWGKNDAQSTSATSTLSGQTIALSVPTTTIPVGDFRFDNPQTGHFEIINSGSGAIQISPLTFTPDNGTTAGEITTVVTLDDTPTIVDLGATPAPMLAGGHKYVVTVTVTPANRAGAIGGKLTVHSPLAGFVDKTVTVSGNAQAAAFQVASIDFGAVDLASTTPMILAATIKNTGDAPLDISAFTVTGTAGVFTFTQPPAQQLAAKATLSINVTYQPKAIGPTDTLTLTANLTGALGGTVPTVLTFKGRGIGRQLFIPNDKPTAPTTFRNPGTLAPVVPVTVTNTGEAVLHITAAMVTGGDVWSLVDAAAVDIPGGTSHDFQVKFAPTAIGAAQAGQLTLTSLDDFNKSVTVNIPLAGTAEARKVAFGPEGAADPIPVIDLGVTGVDLPITLADALKITNLDPGNSFTIHQITLDDHTSFTIEDAPKDQALAANATETYAVQFAPTQRGDFSVTATLFLDQDPVPHAQVMIKGTADAVEAHGGGGCNAGGSTNLVFGLGLGLGLAALRRRKAVAS